MEHLAGPFYDYAKMHCSPSGTVGYTPQSVAELAEVLAETDASHRPLRLRGHAHSFSGAALPRPGQATLLTQGLNHFRFESPGTVTVGAGVRIWDLQAYLETLGYRLPVYNGGGPGPTVGGFIQVGGIPKLRDSVAGGFWNHVEEITLLDARGKSHQLRPDHPHFAWLFGSGGQIGVVAEAKLSILPTGQGDYPQGKVGRIAPTAKPHGLPAEEAPPNHGSYQLFWFSYFTDEAHEATAWELLQGYVKAHPRELIPQAGYAGPRHHGEPMGYRHPIPMGKLHAPLVYPKAEDFLLVGFMCPVRVGRPQDGKFLLQLRAQMYQDARQHGLHLYVQSENMHPLFPHAEYWDHATFAHWQALKSHYDPRHRLNGGTVFPLP